MKYLIIFGLVIFGHVAFGQIGGRPGGPVGNFKITVADYECNKIERYISSQDVQDTTVQMLSIRLYDKIDSISVSERHYPMSLTRSAAHRDSIIDIWAAELDEQAMRCDTNVILSRFFIDPTLIDRNDELQLPEYENVRSVFDGPCGSIIFYNEVTANEYQFGYGLMGLDSTITPWSNFLASAYDEYEQYELRDFFITNYRDRTQCASIDKTLVDDITKERYLQHTKIITKNLGDQIVTLDYYTLEADDRLYFSNDTYDQLIEITAVSSSASRPVFLAELGDVIYSAGFDHIGNQLTATRDDWFLVLTGKQIKLKTDRSTAFRYHIH